MGWGDEDRERERLPAARTESARSRVLGLGEVGEGICDCDCDCDWARVGESLRLLEEEWCGVGEADADLGLGVWECGELVLAGPNQIGRREGVIGIVIREWITWDNGADIGLGKVGGRAEKIRRRGGRRL
jgi:hypothetical protein